MAQKSVILSLSKDQTRGRMTLPCSSAKESPPFRTVGHSASVRTGLSLALVSLMISHSPLAAETADSATKNTIYFEFADTDVGESVDLFVGSKKIFSSVLQYLPTGVAGEANFETTHPKNEVTVSVPSLNLTKTELLDFSKGKYISISIHGREARFVQNVNSPGRE